MKKKISVIKIIRMMLPIYFKYIPYRFVIHVFLAILHGLSFGLLTKGTQLLFDSATKLTQGLASWKNTFCWLIIFGIINLINKILNGIVNCLFSVNRDILKGYIQNIIFIKASKISPENFEDSDKLTLINKAINGQSSACSFVTTFFISIMGFYIPYFVYMSFFLYKHEPILIFVMVLIFIPSIISQYIKTRICDRAEELAAPIRRKVDYYEECIASRESYKENRLLGSYEYFKNKYDKSLYELQKNICKSNYKNGFYSLCSTGVTIIGYIGILIILIHSILIGKISVGVFAAVLASINTLYAIMNELIDFQIGGLSKKIPLVANFISFLELDERGGEEKELLYEGDITLDNVSYVYPHSNTEVIKNVSINIQQGEKIAIVGENGSGKTTLLRLIMGLYNPSSGTVFYGKHNIKDYSLNSINKKTSAVFQKYQKYQLTVEDNVIISDTEANRGKEYLLNLLDKVGIDISEERFVDRENTLLSLEFGKLDLSIGQWQRLAIARGVYKSNNLFFLDEPTASIDPEEETNIYHLFEEIMKNKTSVVVTHRLGIIKMVDRIIVMSNGSIVEVGTHEELLSQGGEYSRLWNAQSQWYE